MIYKYWNCILFIISLFAISSALFAEYILGLQPCELCLKQRYPYYFFIIILLFLLFIPKLFNIYISLLVQIGTIYGIFYSVWHVGVENSLINGPSGCSSGLLLSNSTMDLKEQILNRQVVSCDEVVWSIFGLSAASINTIVLLFIFVINALYLLNKYEKKEKK